MADKYIYNDNGVYTEKPGTTISTGAADAGKITALDETGRLHSSVMPVGVAPDVAVIQASEALSAGDFVNIWNDGGNFRVRKADATTAGKEANGYVLAGVSSGANATVYFEAMNTQLSGLTAGTYFLSNTAGAITATAPSAAGNVVQSLGVAVNATTLNVEIQRPLILA